MYDDIHQEGIRNAVLQHGAVLQNLADACRADEDRLREAVKSPRDVLREHGVDVPADVDVNIVLNTHDTFYLAMPPDPNATLSDEAMMAVAGGKTHGTASSAGSVGSIPSCVSSVSSLGSASSESADSIQARALARERGD